MSNEIIQGHLDSLQNKQDEIYNKQLSLVKDWEGTGLLEGLDYDGKRAVATMLQNQAHQIIKETRQLNEANTIGASSSGGTGFTAGQGEQWAGVAFPLVRKIFSELVAKELVSTQPMSLPNGLIFYLDFKYANSSGQYVANENLYGNVTEGTRKIGKDVDPTGGLYGAGRFGYSKNASTVTASNSAKLGVTAEDVEYNPRFTLSGSGATARLQVGSKKYAKVTVPAPANADLLGARGFDLSVTSGGARISILRQYTRVVGGATTIGTQGSLGAGELSGATIHFLIDDAHNPAANALTLTYYTQPKDNTRGDFEATDPLNPIDNTIKIPSIDIRLASENVVASTRKIQAVWTPELSQDFSAYHSIDAEAEVVSLLSEQISFEVDKEILDMLIVQSRTTGVWSARSNTFFDPDTKTWNRTAAAGAGGFYNTQGEWFQTLGTQIHAVSNKIFSKTLRGNANFLVTSPDVSTIIESIPGFSSNTDGTKAKYSFGAQKAGSLQSKYDVYKLPYFEPNTILVGYKGGNFLETGAIYAPYIPLISTPVVYDTNSYTPRKGLMTRYAKHIVRPEFYGKVNVYDLDDGGALGAQGIF